MRRVDSRAALLVASLLACALLVSSCTGRGRSDQRSETQIVKAEQRGLDASIARSATAKSLIDSYHIEGEVLTVHIPSAAWVRMRPLQQDEAKRTVWRLWRDLYTREHPGTTDRIFLKVEDLQGNDLGSYFE